MTIEVEPDRSELLEIYKVAVDEYRFQATFNWSRTQYWLVFNSGILIAGGALLAQPDRKEIYFPAVVFTIGLAAALLSIRAVAVMHTYYRATRQRVRRIEDDLDLDIRIRANTTAGFRNAKRPTVNVTAVTYLLLGALALADVVGVVTSIVSCTVLTHPRKGSNNAKSQSRSVV